MHGPVYFRDSFFQRIEPSLAECTAIPWPTSLVNRSLAAAPACNADGGSHLDRHLGVPSVACTRRNSWHEWGSANALVLMAQWSSMLQCCCTRDVMLEQSCLAGCSGRSRLESVLSRARFNAFSSPFAWSSLDLSSVLLGLLLGVPSIRARFSWPFCLELP